MKIPLRRYFVQLYKGVLRHKWFVFLACLKMNVPIGQAIFHDWDKFLPSMFIPYARTFYDEDGSSHNVRNAQGTYDASAQGAAFDRAWLGHQNRNRHHWQYWILEEDSGKRKLLPMPENDIREMIADWMGAGRSYMPHWTPPETKKWYLKNRATIQLNEATRNRVEQLLGVTGQDLQVIAVVGADYVQ